MLGRLCGVFSLFLVLCSTASVSAGLVHRWDLNAVDGLELKDKVGECDGTISDTLELLDDAPPTTTLPDIGMAAPQRCLHFDGAVADCVDFGCDDSLSPDQLSVAFWIRASVDPDEDYSERVILSKQGGGRLPSSWEFCFSSGADDSARLQFVSWGGSNKVSVGSDLFTAVQFKAGRLWHHVVGTCDGAVARLYVDGDLMNTAVQTGKIKKSPAFPLLMGKRCYESVPANKWAFPGEVGGPLLIYDLALSAAEIAMYDRPLLPGDADGDGCVDADDAERMAANWLASDADWSQGDFNKDGRVDDLDAAILAANWLKTAPPSESIPEPGGVFMLLMGASTITFLWFTQKRPQLN